MTSVADGPPPRPAATGTAPAWVASLEADAPDVVACWRVFTWDRSGLRLLRRAIREATARIQGHEMQRCRMEHPLVGRLRCGEWLLFLGIHDLMHLEQLHRLRETDAAAGSQEADG